MDFTYISWGSGEMIVRVLRAVAALVGSGQLAGALAASSLLSLLMLTTAAAFAPSIQTAVNPIRKLIVLMVAFGVLLLPCRVSVVDRFAGDDLLQGVSAPNRGVTVVAGVPFGIALPAAFSSVLGSVLTRAVETAMAPVDAEDKLSRTGLWLSARALRTVLVTDGYHDARLPADFRRFVVNCTYFDLQSGRIDPVRLRGGALSEELAKTSGGITSVHSGANASGRLVPVSCPVAWNGGTAQGGEAVIGLSRRIEDLGRWRKFRACNSLQGISLAMTEAQLRAAKNVSRDPFNGAASSCGDRVFSNALLRFGFDGNVIDQFSEVAAIELMRESSHALSSHEPQALAFASFISRRQRDASYVIAGELAALALPGLRGVLEAVVIVLLPVLLVLGILLFEQFASYLKNGLILMVWLQLWPPVMAVINNVGNWVQIAALNEHAIIANGAFSVTGSRALLTELDTQLALSRYMLVLVPLIAWSLVRIGQFSGSMLASRLLQPGESVAGSVAGNVASNNWKADEVNLAPRTSVGPHVATVGDAWGGSATLHPNLRTVSLPASDPGHLSVSHAQTLSQGLSRRAEQSRRQLDEQRKEFSTSVESAYVEAFGSSGSEVLRTLRSQGVEDQTSLRALEGTRSIISQSEGKSRGISQNEGTLQTYHADYGLGLKFGMLGMSSGGSVGSKQTQKVEINEAMQRSYDQLDDKSKEALHQVNSALESSSSSSVSTTLERATSDSLSSALREAQSHQQNYTQARQQSEMFSRASDLAHTSGRTVLREMLKDPANAGLLSDLHSNYHVQGMPFAQAWEQAQESSGIRMDLDAVAMRIIKSSLEPEPKPAELGGEARVREAAAAGRERLAAGSQAPPSAPAEISAAQERIEAGREEISQSQLPKPGIEHYDEKQRLDKTVVSDDGDRMIFARESLQLKSEERINWVAKDMFGLNDDEDEKKPKD